MSVTLARIWRRKGPGAHSTYLVEPPCSECGSYIIYRNWFGTHETFCCPLLHRYPLLLPKGARP